LYFVNAGQSLMVKAAQNNFSSITVGGYDGQDVDFNGKFAVGGTLRVLGQTANPVVVTSLADDTKGAGIVGHVQFDTNNDGGATTASPGDWPGVRVLAGANSSRIENVVQQPNGTITRTPSDKNPYTIGDDPGSTPDTLDIPAGYPATYLAQLQDDDPGTPG